MEIIARDSTAPIMGVGRVKEVADALANATMMTCTGSFSSSSHLIAQINVLALV